MASAYDNDSRPTTITVIVIAVVLYYLEMRRCSSCTDRGGYSYQRYPFPTPEIRYQQGHDCVVLE